MEPGLLQPCHGGQLSHADCEGWRQLPECGASSPMRRDTSSSAAVASEGQGQLSQGRQSVMPPQHGPLISTHLIPMVPCGILGYGYKSRVQLHQNHRPRLLCKQLGPRYHHSQRTSTDTGTLTWSQATVSNHPGIRRPSGITRTMDINSAPGFCKAVDQTSPSAAAQA